MEPSTLFFLNSAVFVAGTLQAATGIGFGLIGGPALLVTISSSDALITTGVLSACIALLLVPSLRSDISWPDLKRLCLGGLAGLPVGAFLFATAGPAFLKIGAAVIVSLSLALLFVKVRSVQTAGSRTGLAAGMICGVLSVALSMPGPVAAAFLLREGRSKAAIRSTILAFFIPAYSATLALQIYLAGLYRTEWGLILWLAPATAFGIVSGQFLSKLLSEATFRIVLRLVLAATIAGLVISALGDLAP
ncbi:MAG: sulfite exporter TauE/SafE family protein [Pseudomonadota bacterium]